MSQGSRIIVILFICFLTWDVTAKEQKLQLIFNNITTDDGLASSNILSLAQDEHGFIWIGTYDGLHRYDGKKIKLYQYKTNVPNSLPDNLIRKIYLDHHNNLFVGTNTGVSMYDKTTDHFINFTLDSASCLFNLNFQAHDIVADAKNNLWIATNTGLLFFDRNNNECRGYTAEPDRVGSLSNSYCTSVHIDSNGKLWVSTQKGLNLFNAETESFRLIHEGTNGQDFSEHLFLKIIEDHTRNLWVNSENGLFRIRLDGPAKNTLHHFEHNPQNPGSISPNMLSGIYVDHENNLWVGAENNGLYKFNRQQNNFTSIASSGNSVNKLATISVNAILQDDANNLWLGTYGHGVLTAPKNSYGISLFRDIIAKNGTFNSTLVNTFLEGENGYIWIGTDGNGLFRFDKKNREFINFSTENSSLTNNYILSMVEDDKGDIWLATWDGGLIQFNPEEETFISFNTANSDIPGDKIYTVASGMNNKIWLGSHYGGLILFDPNTSQFTSVNKINENLGENTVNVVKANGKGKLYVGTTKGLIFYTPSQNKVDKVTGKPAPLNIGQIEINDIELENDTSLWIGTLMGLYHYNPKSGNIKRYTTADGFPADIINALVIDVSGILWVTTSNGICRFDRQNASVTVFNKDDGMQSNEFRPRSALEDDDGNLYFGGINGFNIINPDKISQNRNVPNVVLTELEIFHLPVEPGSTDSPLSQILPETKEIELKHDQSVITFHFAVLDYTSPAKNQHAYMLENFDNNWTYSGNQRQATYTNLDPGKYIFRVKGANNNGIWNETGTALVVQVKPPWWNTWWFTTIIILVLALTVFAVVYIRISTLNKQKLLLEKTVALRTKELSRINATKDKLFSIVAHDLINPFNIILGYTNLLIEGYDDFSKKEQKKVLTELHESGENAYNLLKNLLDWSRSQRGTIDFSPRQVMVSEVVKKSIREFRSMSRQKNISIIDKISEKKEIPIFADINMLSIIFRNLITNAIKFSDSESDVVLDVDETNGFVQFKIADEGIGMTAEKMDSIFKLGGSNSEAGTFGEKGTGLGLILTREFVEKHNGKIWVESEPGKGSTFYFTIPKSKQQLDS